MSYFSILGPKEGLESVSILDKSLDSFHEAGRINEISILDILELMGLKMLKIIRENDIFKVSLPMIIRRCLSREYEAPEILFRNFLPEGISEQITMRSNHTLKPIENKDYSITNDDLLIFPAKIVGEPTFYQGQIIPSIEINKERFDLEKIPKSLVSYLLYKS